MKDVNRQLVQAKSDVNERCLLQKRPARPETQPSTSAVDELMLSLTSLNKTLQALGSLQETLTASLQRLKRGAAAAPSLQERARKADPEPKPMDPYDGNYDPADPENGITLSEFVEGTWQVGAEVMELILDEVREGAVYVRGHIYHVTLMKVVQ
jgi:hypothetical protein